MTRKEILNRLEEIGCNIITYENIHYYLKRNCWTLKQITAINPSESKGYCIIEVDNQVIGTF